MQNTFLFLAMQNTFLFSVQEAFSASLEASLNFITALPLDVRRRLRPAVQRSRSFGLCPWFGLCP